MSGAVSERNAALVFCFVYKRGCVPVPLDYLMQRRGTKHEMLPTLRCDLGGL